jgi:hypothetical protein
MPCINCGDTVEGRPQSSELDNVFPLNSAEAQVAEAMRVAKERNRQESQAESIVPYIEKVDSFSNVREAVEYISQVSQHERDLLLRAEKLSKNRKTLLGHFGQ